MSAPPPTSVSQSRKAAMVVQVLLRDGGDLPLSQLPEEAQAHLTRELGAARVRNHNQKITAAARAIAERKTVGDLS